MAATRLIPMHLQKSRSMGQCLKERTDYAKNDEKTEAGQFVSSYECDPSTVDLEFEITKNQYAVNTGRNPKEKDVIAYQIRQSFKPGETTPEEANQILQDYFNNQAASARQAALRGSELSFSSSFTFHLYLPPVLFLHARSCCKNGITLLLPQDSAIPFLHSRIGRV